MSELVVINCSLLPAPHTREHCRKCECRVGYLARYIHQNGVVALRWVCEWCEDFKTAPDLPHALLEAHRVALDELPLRQSNYDPDLDRTPCVVCDEPSDEMHHWAPTILFPQWPYHLVVALCATHHREWHDTMRSHGLRWPHELVEAR